MTLVKEKRRTISKLLIAVILLVVLIPLHQARAEFPTPAALVTGALEKINEIMLEGVGYVLKWAALTLEAAVKPETQAVIINTFVVQESWRIIRDFVNMFFILFLIIMAFGTIFDSSKYSWKVGRPPILVTFLIAALLINFSLVIGQYVIEIGNGLAAIFLKQIAGFGQDMATGFDIGKAIPGGEFKAQGLAMIANDSARAIFTGIFSLIFLIIALFAFLAALLFAIIRIPVLWFLLIVSPIAWIGYILPNIRGQTWSKWWNALISWVFFLPVYLFFLMFAVMFMRRKIEITATLPSAQGAALFTGPGGALSDLLFYILTLLFMVFGLKAAYSVGSFAANGAGKLMGGIEKGVKKYMPGAGYARAIGAGAKEGLKAKGEEIKEKGVFGIGGAQAERLRQAKWTERFGFGAARGAADRAMAEETDKELKKLQQLNLTLDQLNEKLKSGSRPERLAAFKLKAENGWLAPTDLDEINRIMRELGGGRSAAGTSLLGSLRKGKFHEMARSTADKERIFAGLEDLETKKAFGLDMAESRELMSTTLATQLLNLYKGDTQETRKKVEDAVRTNIKNFARTKDERAAFLVDPAQDKTIRRLLAQQMSEDGETNTYAKYKTSADLFGGEDEALSRAMLDRIIKDDPITHAELQFQQELGLRDPTKLAATYVPTAAEMAGLIPKYNEKMEKMGAGQLAGIDKSKWTPQFGAALQNKINALETVEPTQPAIPPVIDPATGNVLRRGRKEIPGAGKRFLQALRKTASTDPTKLATANRLRV